MELETDAEANAYYDAEQIQILSGIAKQKQDEKIAEIKARHKKYEVREAVINHYFLLTSSVNKQKIILRFLERVDSVDTALRLMDYLPRASKEFIFPQVDPNTNFIFDKDIISEHDRMLEKDILESTIKDDLDWFSTLPPAKQVDLIIELLRRAGGNVRKSLYVPLLRKFHETLTIRNSIPIRHSIKPFVYSIKDSIKPAYENYNPIHPASIEVEKQRKKWDIMIDKYRTEVEKDERMLRHQVEEPIVQKSKGRKGSKTSGKSKKSSKSSKSNKSKDKGKGKGKGKGKRKDKGKEQKEDELDWLQLLPIWIVKKIFRYLDQKSLKNLKKVSGYYSYVVQELVKEVKMRKKLDSAVIKLQAAIDPIKLEAAMKTEIKFENAVYRLPKLTNKEEIGAISIKLVPKKRETYAEKSLVAEIAKESGQYVPHDVVSFPRHLKDTMLLYRYQPCFLKDVNLTLGARTDEKQSFVTYSLPSKSSTLSISVDPETLSEW